VIYFPLIYRKPSSRDTALSQKEHIILIFVAI